MIGSKAAKPFAVRIALVGCIVALAILAWLPAKHLTRTMLGGHAEHFIAYLGTTIVMGLAFQKRLRPDIQCLLLILYAAVLEAGQIYSPGRHASINDFVFSAVGVVIGGLLLWIARSRILGSQRTK
jgi:VanZ family protein